MAKYISQLTLLLAILFFTNGANAIGKIYLDQTGLYADEIIAKLNIYRTGARIILEGCAERCPTGLTANKKTVFMVDGKKIKRKEIKHHSGQAGYVKFFKKTKSVILINWK